MQGSYASLLGELENSFNWDLTNWPAGGIGSQVSTAVRTLAKAQVPDLADMFPFHHGIKSAVHLGDDYLAASLTSINGMNTGGEFKSDEIAELSKAATLRPISHVDVVGLIAPRWFSAETFTYIGPYKKPHGCWPHLVLHLTDWLNRYVVPDVVAKNRNRVLRAIPPAPIFDVARILNALWVLESETKSNQGSAFTIEEAGTITCSHVLAEDTCAFRATDPMRRKFPVRVLHENATIDLAVIAFDGDNGPALRRGSADNIEMMDHILVAGFPNYRTGDSGYAAPGLVTGFRPISAIRRILTNVPIVSGNSGGPVIGADGTVIGVAVTGADSFAESSDTENHGIIPIDALDYLSST